MDTVSEEKTGKWYGATVLSQGFAVRSRSQQDVLKMLNEHLHLPNPEKGLEALKGAFALPYEERFQAELDSKCGTEFRVVKVEQYKIVCLHDVLAAM